MVLWCLNLNITKSLINDDTNVCESLSGMSLTKNIAADKKSSSCKTETMLLVTGVIL